MTAAVALGLQSCSDWNDHYVDGSTDNIAGANTTLWEQINGRAELSNFAKLLQRVGYDDLLSTDQSFTVWAPANSALDFDKYNVLTDSLLKSEILNNHIARGYYRATGDIADRVYLLNKKVLDFKGGGNYTIGDVPVDSANLIGKNGILHLLNSGIVEYRPNFYDFFLRTHEDVSATDSIGSLFKKYQRYEIDLDNSVVGPWQDGQRTYLDTVYVESNDLMDELNAKLSTEDSTYTMIIPSDRAWAVAKEKINSYYEMPAQIQTFTYQKDKDGDNQYTVNSLSNVDNKDSLQRVAVEYQLLKNLVYSNTVNTVLANEKQPTGDLDSIRSTSGRVIQNTLDYRGMAFYTGDATDLFEGAKKQSLSNGTAWVTDTLRLKPWNYCPVICIRATSGTCQATYDNVSRAEVVTASSEDRNSAVYGSLHGTSFYQVLSAYNKRPSLYYYVPGMRKTKYAVYLSLVPQNINDKTATPYDHVIQVKALDYLPSGKANGKTGTSLPSLAALKNIETDKTVSSVTFSYGTEDSARVVTKFVGVFEPNFCYSGLTGATTPYPMLEVKPTYASKLPDSKQMTLGISNIILVPMDAVEYYRSKGDITDYTDEMPELFWNLNKETY